MPRKLSLYLGWLLQTFDAGCSFPGFDLNSKLKSMRKWICANITWATSSKWEYYPQIKKNAKDTCRNFFGECGKQILTCAAYLIECIRSGVIRVFCSHCECLRWMWFGGAIIRIINVDQHQIYELLFFWNARTIFVNFFHLKLWKLFFMNIIMDPPTNASRSWNMFWLQIKNQIFGFQFE